MAKSGVEFLKTNRAGRVIYPLLGWRLASLQLLVHFKVFTVGYYVRVLTHSIHTHISLTLLHLTYYITGHYEHHDVKLLIQSQALLTNTAKGHQFC